MDQLDFNYRFMMNADHTGFDVEEADNLEVILNAWNPATQQVEAGLYKVTLKAGGNTSYKFVRTIGQQPGLALVVLVPSEFEFAIADKLSGEWRDCFSGSIKNQVSVAEGKEYAQLDRDTWSLSCTINSDFPAAADRGIKADKTTLDLSVLSDKENHKGDIAISWKQNDRKMLDLTMREGGDKASGIHHLDLSQFASSASILDVMAVILSSRSIDEAKLTLLDDLTTTISISNMVEALTVVEEASSSRGSSKVSKKALHSP